MSQYPFTRLHEVECQRVIFKHSQSFYLSSLLLPPDVRMCSWAVYGFCRTADDVIDEADSGSDLRKRVEILRNRLEQVYSGSVDNVVDEAFAQFVHHYRLPRSIPSSLIDGFEIDASGIDFNTEEELIQYSFHVASTVGLMLVYAMDSCSSDTYLKASDLGVAMQLTNIARDMGADFRKGRFYVPSTWRQNLSLLKNESDWNLANEATRELAKKLIDLANAHYMSAAQGISLLPPRCRVAITASMYVYGAINDAIRLNAFDTISARAYVSVPKKIFLVAKAAHAVVQSSSNTGLTEGPSDTILKSNLAKLGLVDTVFSDNTMALSKGAR